MTTFEIMKQQIDTKNHLLTRHAELQTRLNNNEEDQTNARSEIALVNIKMQREYLNGQLREVENLMSVLGIEYHPHIVKSALVDVA